jgi:hypothetical protein
VFFGCQGERSKLNLPKISISRDGAAVIALNSVLAAGD